MNVKDITGQRFGRLTALAPTEERHRSSVVWECRCDCGELCRVPGDWLRRGSVRSCGCLREENRRRNIAGQRRGHLTAIRSTEQRRDGATVWEWRCDCGATVLKSISLVQGEAMSTMCPDCARRLKAEQGRAMYDRQARDDETGLSLGALDNIRKGKPYRTNTSGVRGVTWHAGEGKWCVRLHDGGKMKTLGYYDTIEEAAEIRRQAVAKKYGTKEEE